VDTSQATDRVARVLEVLPERYRDVLTYRFLLDLSVRETALSMGITETNFKVLQMRALKRAAALASGLSNQQEHHTPGTVGTWSR
jgi:DNA-directed RNA polymerase specialized sigma24 family protein